MKIGVNRWTLPGEWSLEKCFSSAASAGFQSMEINVADEGYLTPATTEAEAAVIGKAADSAGIELSSISSGLGWSYPLSSPDPAVRSRGMDAIRAELRIARWLGLDTVLCVPGVVTPDTPYDAAYERSQAALMALAPEAEAAGVCIGVENVWNKFLLSPLEMARFIDEIGSPGVQAYFDAGNVLVFGDPRDWIRILGTRIRKVHVKDFKANIGNISAFCNPFQGDLPWDDVRNALEAAGYNGYVTAEVDGYRTNPELGLRHIAECMQAAFG